MRYVFLIVFVLSLQKFTAQNDKQVYTGGYLTITPPGSKTEKPLGKNAKLVIDDFFHNYEITYSDSNGDGYKIIFEYVSGGGKEMTKLSFNGAIYYVVDTFLNTGIGSVTFLPSKDYNLGYPTYHITKLIKTKSKK